MYALRFKRICAMVFPVLLFAYAIYRLFMLRFDHGDFYPAYSSLRADPLGTRILYESLERLPGFDVQRNFVPLDRETPEGPVVLFYTGESLDESRSYLEQNEEPLKAFVRQGGRLVLCFKPTMYIPGNQGKQGFENVFRERLRDLAGEDEEGIRELLSPVDRYDLWGVNFAFAALPYLSKLNTDEATGQMRPVSWHSTMYFSDWDPPWKPVLNRGEEQVVMLERDWGAGSVVIASDSYFMSNEAMIAERRSGLIQYLLGDFKQVRFDESHHAIVQQQGIMDLARDYRLHGAMFSLLLLAGLFVWKNAVSLVPPHPSTLPQGNLVISDKDASEGFRILLRRNISPRQLLALCLEEWERTCLRMRGSGGGVMQREVERRHQQMRELVGRGADAADTYRRVTDVLNTRKPGRRE